MRVDVCTIRAAQQLQILLQTNHIVRAAQIQQMREKQKNGFNVPVTEVRVVSDALRVSTRLYFRLLRALLTRFLFLGVFNAALLSFAGSHGCSSTPSRR